jgi:hypothetical protein
MLSVAADAGRDLGGKAETSEIEARRYGGSVTELLSGDVEFGCETVTSVACSMTGEYCDISEFRARLGAIDKRCWPMLDVAELGNDEELDLIGEGIVAAVAETDDNGKDGGGNAVRSEELDRRTVKPGFWTKSLVFF